MEHGAVLVVSAAGRSLQVCFLAASRPRYPRSTTPAPAKVLPPLRSEVSLSAGPHIFALGKCGLEGHPRFVKPFCDFAMRADE